MEDRILVEGEIVSREVSVDLEGTVVADLLRNRCIHVPESCFASVVMALRWKESQDPVRIGHSSSEDERCSVFLQRTLDFETAGKKAESQGSRYLLAVSLLCMYVEDRRNPSSEIGGNGTLVQFGIADYVRIESGQYTEDMVRVEDGSVVEQDEVLVN